MSRVTVRIERLVLEGLSAPRPQAVVAAIESEIARAFREPGVLPVLEARAIRPPADPRPISVRSQSPAELGTVVASSILGRQVTR